MWYNKSILVIGFSKQVLFFGCNSKDIAKKYVSLLLIRSNPFYEPKSSPALFKVAPLQEPEKKMKRKAPEPPNLLPKTDTGMSENMSAIPASRELSSSPKVGFSYQNFIFVINSTFMCIVDILRISAGHLESFAYT